MILARLRFLLLLIQAISPSLAAPFLPSISYPVFYFTPRQGQEEPVAQATPHFPVISDLPLPNRAEVSQWHSQDDEGRSVFGFQSPEQARLEARASDGSVRGTYSYLDPTGNIVKMEYWDDGTGFHVRGNAVPSETPEVAAARAQHLRLYQATLDSLLHLPSHLGDEDDGMYHNSQESNNFGGLLPSFNNKDSQRLNHFSYDSDSISLENPELFGDTNYLGDEDKGEKTGPGGGGGGGGGGGVEGEVELGEDVGPEEDDGQHDGMSEEHVTGKEEEKYHKIHGMVKNQEESSSDENINNKEAFEDVPKKFFYHLRYPAHSSSGEITSEEKNPASEERDSETEDREKSESEEPEKDGHHQHESSEADHQGNEEDRAASAEGSTEQKADEHFETLEHLFHPDGTEEDYPVRRNSGQGDAETAENRKTAFSQANDRISDSHSLASDIIKPAYQRTSISSVSNDGKKEVDLPPLRPAVVQPLRSPIEARQSPLYSSPRLPVILVAPFTEVHDQQLSPRQLYLTRDGT